jgi:hypothetical protein
MALNDDFVCSEHLNYCDSFDIQFDDFLLKSDVV